ncbi:MAG: hypothetical protein CME58_12705 [Halieaceae bacterium]|nr:hypothetical protein [Halieaceae bacterium]|tara:strand:- start:207 stop:890 length:684 start_codon:yes stop_codon:yes gene_type:complete
MNLLVHVLNASHVFTRKLHVHRPEIVPPSFDWREHIDVGRVHQQGHCQSCWAFSAAGSIDYLIKQKRPDLEVDVQALLDCTPKTQGCEGGVMDKVFRYDGVFPVRTPAGYHYDAQQHKCARNGKGVRVTEFRVLEHPEKYLNYLVNMFGPISAAVDFRGLAMQHGHVQHCGENPNHAVLVVGYTPDYWIVKNSFGNRWGDHGFAYVPKGKCGIDTYASFATGIEWYI